MGDPGPRIGHDLVDVERFGRALAGKEEGWARRVFTASEWAHAASRPDRVAVLAVRFAAKEAAFKALGTGWGQGVAWQDVEVLGGGRRAPRMRLQGRAAEVAEALGLELSVSLTHTDSLAAATVLAWPR
jgi:holo-[acyl-carrier protein] synthase